MDTYLDALEQFPKSADKLLTKKGAAVLLKTEIFKGLMYYAYEKENGRGKIYPVDLDRVKEIQEMNKAGQKPDDLVDLQALIAEAEEIDLDFAAVNNIIDLPIEEKRRRRKKKKKKRGGGGRQQGGNQQAKKGGGGNQQQPKKGGSGKQQSRAKNQKSSNSGQKKQQSGTPRKPGESNKNRRNQNRKKRNNRNNQNRDNNKTN